MDKEQLFKHYDSSRSNYSIEGESHLEYYKQKYPNNFNKLLTFL